MQRCFQSKYLGSNSAEGLHFSAFHCNSLSDLTRDFPGYELSNMQRAAVRLPLLGMAGCERSVKIISA